MTTHWNKKAAQRVHETAKAHKTFTLFECNGEQAICHVSFDDGNTTLCGMKTASSQEDRPNLYVEHELPRTTGCPQCFGLTEGICAGCEEIRTLTDEIKLHPDGPKVKVCGRCGQDVADMEKDLAAEKASAAPKVEIKNQGIDNEVTVEFGPLKVTVWSSIGQTFVQVDHNGERWQTKLGDTSCAVKRSGIKAKDTRGKK